MRRLLPCIVFSLAALALPAYGAGEEGLGSTGINSPTGIEMRRKAERDKGKSDGIRIQRKAPDARRKPLDVPRKAPDADSPRDGASGGSSGGGTDLGFEAEKEDEQFRKKEKQR
jgi:hypothetical protein